MYCITIQKIEQSEPGKNPQQLTIYEQKIEKLDLSELIIFINKPLLNNQNEPTKNGNTTTTNAAA
jgi:hypothetical protein